MHVLQLACRRLACRAFQPRQLVVLEFAASCLTDTPAASLLSCCRHKFFNTNNLWVNLRKLKATLDASGGWQGCT